LTGEDLTYQPDKIERFPSELLLNFYIDILEDQPQLFLTLMILIYLQKLQYTKKDKNLDDYFKKLPASITVLLISIFYSGFYQTAKKVFNLSFTDKIMHYFRNSKQFKLLKDNMKKYDSLSHDLLLERGKGWDHMISQYYQIINQIKTSPQISDLNLITRQMNQKNSWDWSNLQDQVIRNSLIEKISKQSTDIVKKEDIDLEKRFILTISTKKGKKIHCEI
jgi:hypothetical protein